MIKPHSCIAGEGGPSLTGWVGEGRRPIRDLRRSNPEGPQQQRHQILRMRLVTLDRLPLGPVAPAIKSGQNHRTAVELGDG